MDNITIKTPIMAKTLGRTAPTFREQSIYRSKLSQFNIQKNKWITLRKMVEFRENLGCVLEPWGSVVPRENGLGRKNDQFFEALSPATNRINGPGNLNTPWREVTIEFSNQWSVRVRKQDMATTLC
jgi:hypothetical protein